jgi:hypothetical protein
MSNTPFQYIKKTYSFPNNWTEKQYFIHACFVSDLQLFYKEWVEQGKKSGRAQFFNTDAAGRLVHKYWSPSNICCETSEILTPENIDVKIGYWSPNVWKPINKELLLKAKKTEALECQLIDCNCNDCFYFHRDTNTCKVFQKKIVLNPNTCCPQNKQCFLHRIYRSNNN